MKTLPRDEIKAWIFNSNHPELMNERNESVQKLYNTWIEKETKNIKFSYLILKIWVISMIFLIVGYAITNPLYSGFCFLFGSAIFITIFTITAIKDRKTAKWKKELIKEANLLMENSK